MATRQCSRSSCARPGAATLTYVYADSTVVVGQLSAAAEPHSYDLCAHHADRFTAPRGWEMVRLQTSFEEAPPSDSDLMALADAIRETAKRPVAPPAPARREIRRPVDMPAPRSRRAGLSLVPDEAAVPNDKPPAHDEQPASGEGAFDESPGMARQAGATPTRGEGGDIDLTDADELLDN